MKRLLMPAAGFSALVLPVLSLMFTAGETAPSAPAPAPAPIEEAAPAPAPAAPAIPAFSLEAVDEDVLWLARCAYSETKKPDEQELVAWVVRNRVETKYRGKTRYRDVVLDPYQFSAFNKDSHKKRFYSGLTPTSRSRGWTKALEIAHAVYHAPADTRPFGKKTRHFYSERSMKNRKAPSWAAKQTPVALDRPIDPDRFRFYDSVY